MKYKVSELNFNSLWKPSSVSVRLRTNMAVTDYTGHDPFDGLNSRLLKSTPLYKNPLVRLALLQVNKRSPVDLRSFLSVPRERNSKGIALVILGLLLEYLRTGEATLLNEARRLADWLLEQCCDIEQWGGACWGYHFDWQARAFYVPVGKPNIITTVYVTLALLELSKICGDELYGTVARTSVDFFTRSLLTRRGDSVYFAYIPGETALVHNANLWGCALTQMCGDEPARALAAEAVQTSLHAQREDGAWPYGERSHHQFVDGFHTGYNLEALSLYQKSGGRVDVSCAIEIGLDYYAAHLFDADGRPRYYDTQPYPIDSHCAAQAILTFLKIGTVQQKKLALLVADWAMSNLYDKKRGWFVYQQNRYYVNRIVYLRWTQAWMYYAFEFLLSNPIKGEDSLK